MKTSGIMLIIMRAMIVLPFLLLMPTLKSVAGKLSSPPEKKWFLFDTYISDVAEQYVGMTVKLGGDPDIDGMTDNSHLFCKIYTHAARQSGLRFPGYMTMESLISIFSEVNSCCLRNGDLIVLTDGNAAMIYDIQTPKNFRMLYASEKRGHVTSFHSQHVVFEVYWLKNLQGFYRLREGIVTVGNRR